MRINGASIVSYGNIILVAAERQREISAIAYKGGSSSIIKGALLVAAWIPGWMLRSYAARRFLCCSFFPYP